MPRVVSATFIAIGEVQGAVFEVVDGPHMLPLERPREFRAALDRHLERAAAS